MVIILSSCFLSCSLRFSSRSASTRLLFASFSSVTSMNLVKMVDSSSEPSQSFRFLFWPTIDYILLMRYMYVYSIIPLFLVVSSVLLPSLAALSSASFSPALSLLPDWPEPFPPELPAWPTLLSGVSTSPKRTKIALCTECASSQTCITRNAAISIHLVTAITRCSWITCSLTTYYACTCRDGNDYNNLFLLCAYKRSYQ